MTLFRAAILLSKEFFSRSSWIEEEGVMSMADAAVRVGVPLLFGGTLAGRTTSFRPQNI
jgi:hypothetical protein